MINIAICDNNKYITGFTERLLETIANEQGISIDCNVYFDGASLITAIKEQQMFYDLIYMDIEMNKINGIQAAKLIREMEMPTLIVYLSGHEEYMKELFCTEPFRFLQKPINTVEFRKVFLAACNKIRKKEGYFSFNYNKVFYKIPFNRITYFESHSRTIFIHVSEHFGATTYKFYGKMNYVDNRISTINNRFLRIHQSFLINFDYVKSISFTEAIMMDGRHLQISENRRKNIQQRFCCLLNIEMEEGNEISHTI